MVPLLAGERKSAGSSEANGGQRARRCEVGELQDETGVQLFSESGTTGHSTRLLVFCSRSDRFSPSNTMKIAGSAFLSGFFTPPADGVVTMFLN